MLKRVLILFWFLFLCFDSNAQIVISKPTLGFSQVCASSVFNNYNLSFTFFPTANLLPGNQFVVELSDTNGSFVSPTTLTSTGTPANTSFSFPNTVYGTNYKIRIRSTNPATIGAESNVFPAYYLIDNQPFTINSNRSVATLCSAQPVVLSVDSGTNSPLQYPLLNYKWFKNNVVIPGASTSALTVSQAGDDYYAQVDYGTCGTNAYSNVVSAVSTVINPNIQISDSSTLLCEGVSKQLICSVNDLNYSYTWYKDGQVVSGAAAYTYDVQLLGAYKVVMTNSGCMFTSNEITIVSNPVSVSIVPLSTSLIIPGQQFTLTTTTTALQPTYIWYRNSVLMPSQTGSSLPISQNGSYEVDVKQNQGCLAQSSSVIAIQYPTGFNLDIKNTSAYTSCQSTNANLAIDSFQALTTADPVSILGNSYNYVYQWYKNGVAVPGATNTSLNLSGALSNGSYKLGVTIPDFGEILSNSVDVQLKITEDIAISNNSSLCKDGDSVVLQSKLSDPNYTYDWYFNGTKTTTNNTGALTVTHAGSYYLIVNSGTCSLQSNTISLQLADFDLSISSPTPIILPGQQMVLTATTDALQPTYTWSKDGVSIPGKAGNTLNITANGTYDVTVTQNQGCLISKSSEIAIQYPTGFSLSIKDTSTYTPCQSTSAGLVIDNFQASTGSSPINIIANTFNYGYQWYKDGLAVSGATTTSLNLSGSLVNGSYKLGVTIPGFGEILSNSFDVQLVITEDITISNNSPLCKDGDLVVLQSKLSNPNYTYDWYFNSAKTATNNTGVLTVTKPGNYYLIVRSGTCTLQSNTINLKEGLFGVFISPEASFIVPGQTMMLTVNTGALQPAFAWYKNGTVLNGENLNTLKVSDPGVYKVVVDQTQGCLVENSAEIALGYPSGFTVTITPEAGYQECTSTSATLSLVKMIANSSLGNIDLTTNSYNYTFQWYKNNDAIPNAVNSILLVSDYSQNDNYKLQVIIPDFTDVYSNTVDVLLGFPTALVIAQTGVFCDEGTEVTLTANYSDPAFTYQWFESSSDSVIGTESAIVVNKSGNYYLKISQKGCGLVSNTIAIQPFSFSQLSVDTPENIVITEGEFKLITATGGDSYQWYFNNQLVSESNSYKVTQVGTYTLIIKVGSCQKTFTFEVTYHEKKYVIANTVTPNGDGFNDYWSIPLEYAYVDNIQVTIYDTSGNIILRTTNYQNNWPDGSSQLPKDFPVCYFTIEKVGGSVLKEGSITVVK